MKQWRLYRQYVFYPVRANVHSIFFEFQACGVGEPNLKSAPTCLPLAILQRHVTCVTVYPSIYLSINLFINQTIYLSICITHMQVFSLARWRTLLVDICTFNSMRDITFKMQIYKCINTVWEKESAQEGNTRYHLRKGWHTEYDLRQLWYTTCFGMNSMCTRILNARSTRPYILLYIGAWHVCTHTHAYTKVHTLLSLKYTDIRTSAPWAWNNSTSASNRLYWTSIQLLLKHSLPPSNAYLICICWYIHTRAHAMHARTHPRPCTTKLPFKRVLTHNLTSHTYWYIIWKISSLPCFLHTHTRAHTHTPPPPSLSLSLSHTRAHTYTYARNTILFSNTWLKNSS
jgi:hypothetical protein